ncbi:MAG: hypothetical protein U0939_18810 [Pirellulales bacterium]
MAKKKGPPAAKPSPRKKQSSKKLGKPDTSVLANYDPTDAAGSHPAWVRTNFAAYIAPQAGHEMTSVRELSHAGHTVKIITTYRIEVDGHAIHLHFSVDEDGQVHTHAIPFVTYNSATDLMKAVINAYPGAFAGHGDPHGHADHHGHENGDATS